jgi:hypothetical protein
MNFGASIHRVVGLDIADPVFVPDSIEIRPQWESRIVLLLDQLQAAPSILRLSYLADIEDPALVEDRLDALESTIRAHWNDLPAPYELDIEAQIFWRLGDAPDAGSRRRRGGAE